ncbi:phosphatidate cytidylyltransferase [Flavobacterium sp. NKUCC04_CG]|uniref:phosphatidate cytidylyltransferase n=1 Tax=Flavobacterium sp. NKUCC04_CG TaxID=2842121 RepID=UPI001C5BDBAD|nr:phosphatidate cytidylyltransferase [Flavobacterium sp. NKUCC04_CG]MBW3519619.1 phosphatidate cytidylyltransferase [Flavobacterium sp. NKUCC04_CG]
MSESFVRAISGSVYIILLLAATLYSQVSFQILFGLFLLIGIYEFSKLTRISLVWSFALGITITAAIYALKDSAAFFYLNFIGVALLIYLFVDLFSKKSKQDKTNLEKYLLLLGYIILPFNAILYLPFLNQIYHPNIIIGIFILIWTNDTFAYIVGKKWGRHKLFERISPKKTIEGFAGGLIFTVIAATILSKYFTEFNAVLWISSAIFVSIFGTIGDLVESKFKRQAGVKDSGAIMPGHGGILDRLDSIIFVSPFLYLIFQILN